MYFVNKEQIEQRLNYIPVIIQAAGELNSAASLDTVQTLAMERVLHTAIETITDVGSYLIDGFIMRDASSYEDIIEILADEQVIPHKLATALLELVKLRKPLVQQYYELNPVDLKASFEQVAELMHFFSNSVKAYLKQEGI
jgi:uncharacterized protein YutE (UPF0331/DUF86 family)